jgi:hypothetical protein
LRKSKFLGSIFVPTAMATSSFHIEKKAEREDSSPLLEYWNNGVLEY